MSEERSITDEVQAFLDAGGESAYFRSKMKVEIGGIGPMHNLVREYMNKIMQDAAQQIIDEMKKRGDTKR